MLTEETIDEYITRIPESGCWIWNKYVCKNGYGHISIKHKTYKAHRFVYELLGRNIPDGLQLDHLCRVRCCVNPDHLEPVTGKVNVLRGFAPTSANAKKTHCPRGHEFTKENTMIKRTTGGRICRACHYARNNRRSAEKIRNRNFAIPQLPETKE